MPLRTSINMSCWSNRHCPQRPETTIWCHSALSCATAPHSTNAVDGNSEEVYSCVGEPVWVNNHYVIITSIYNDRNASVRWTTGNMADEVTVD